MIEISKQFVFAAIARAVGPIDTPRKPVTLEPAEVDLIAALLRRSISVRTRTDELKESIELCAAFLLEASNAPLDVTKLSDTPLADIAK